MKKSQSQEDYLKFIHEAGHGQYVSNKEIVTGLNVAPPSVSEMITKLAQEGLVAYKPYMEVDGQTQDIGLDGLRLT